MPRCCWRSRSRGDDYTINRIRRMYGDTERNINLKHPIPVYVTYQTAFFDDDGKAAASR